MVYTFPWYGIQGTGCYYGEGQDRVFPGIDLVEVSNARSVVLWHAAFPLLADNVSCIRPDQEGDHAYNNLYCGEIEESTKLLDVAQRYIKYTKEYTAFKAIIKVRTSQSNGDKNLCGSEADQPDWSHVCNTSWGKDQGISATPNDIPVQLQSCCRNDTTLFNPPPLDDPYSPNIFDFTATLADGCGEEFGNRNYLFENECDMKWAGLAITGCVDDGPYKNEEDHYWFTDLDDAREYGYHLAHHYMQAYFSFKEGLEKELPGDNHNGYPFGISSLNLGIMIARWIAGTGSNADSVQAAMRFSNIYFAETRKGVLAGHVGMTNAYHTGNMDQVPWPLSDPEKWKYDFGYLDSEEYTNRLAVFRVAFLETMFEYFKRDLSGAWNERYFDGLLVHYYSHWACIGTTLNYLNILRDGFVGGATGEGVAALPVVINELGNRRRLDSFDPNLDCYACDKMLDYETGWSRIRIADAEREPELTSTQAASAARRMIRFSAPNQDGSGNNIRGVTWEWMMKPKALPTDKCEIVQGCIHMTLLPGYRFPAFDAYKFFVYIINRLMYTPIHLINTHHANNPGVPTVQVVFNGSGGAVTACWCYNPVVLYDEDITCTAQIPRPLPGYTVAYSYNAVGEFQDILTVEADSVEANLSTSPLYLSWGGPLSDWDPEYDPVDDYSEILCVLNDESAVPNVPEIRVHNFDTESHKQTIVENQYFDMNDLRGLAWMTSTGQLLVSDNATNQQGIHRFGDLRVGLEYGYEDDKLDLSSECDEVGSITTRIGKYLIDDDPVTYETFEALHILVDTGGEVYKVLTYRLEVNNFVKVGLSTVDINLNPGEKPRQLRVAHYWETERGDDPDAFVETLFLSTNKRILYLRETQPNTFIGFTTHESSREYNGFGFALDGDLYIANSEAGSTAILKYEIDWSVEPPFSSSSVAISCDQGYSPMGMRISPFGTLVVTLDTPNGFEIAEYVNDADGLWNTIDPRIILTETSADLVPGDLAFSYDR